MPGRSPQARLRRRSSAWPVIELPWVRYTRGRRLLWRIRIPADEARPRLTDEEIVAIRARGRSVRQRWATEAAPSPADWVVPSGVRPAWNWAPPDGLVPRLDRVPAWVRMWYRTPFVDRYAHSWMWWHGGWDVLPREAEISSPVTAVCPCREGELMSVFTVDLENRAGQLARLCEAMADNHVNLVLSAVARGDAGTVMFVADDEAGAQGALAEAGIGYTMRPALTIRMENQPGAGAAAFRKLADAGINTDLLLPLRVSEQLFFAVICVDDEEKARHALADQIVAADAVP